MSDLPPVWLCCINDVAFHPNAIEQSIPMIFLSENERSSVMKFVFEDDRKRALLSILLQRALIYHTHSIVIDGSCSAIKRSREVFDSVSLMCTSAQRLNETC